MSGGRYENFLKSVPFRLILSHFCPHPRPLSQRARGEWAWARADPQVEAFHFRWFRAGRMAGMSAGRVSNPPLPDGKHLNSNAIHTSLPLRTWACILMVEWCNAGWQGGGVSKPANRETAGICRRRHFECGEWVGHGGSGHNPGKAPASGQGTGFSSFIRRIRWELCQRRSGRLHWASKFRPTREHFFSLRGIGSWPFFCGMKR